jgi:uncharacterized protein
MHVLEVRNAELIESLTRQAAELGITNAAIVALIGAIDGFTVSTNPAGDATAHTYSSYPLPAEMTGNGEIVGGKPHIHAAMAVQGDRTIGGHLHKAHLHTSFARAANTALDDDRVTGNPRTGSASFPTRSGRCCSNRFRCGRTTTPRSTTAQRLFCHPNTERHRLRRIEKHGAGPSRAQEISPKYA